MRRLFTALTIMVFVASISFTGFAADSNNTESKIKKEIQKGRTKIAYQQLPDTVKIAVGKVCPEPDIKNITKEDIKGKTAYEITCTKNNKTEYYLFSETGKQLKKESTKTEKKEHETK